MASLFSVPVKHVETVPVKRPAKQSQRVRSGAPTRTDGRLLTVEKAKPINYTNPIAAKIQQRRYQMLVHAYRYYELDAPVVDDATWDRWAAELHELQLQNPDVASKVKFAEEFADFDPSTGFNLPYNIPEIKLIVERLGGNEE